MFPVPGFLLGPNYVAIRSQMVHPPHNCKNNKWSCLVHATGFVTGTMYMLIGMWSYRLSYLAVPVNAVAGYKVGHHGTAEDHQSLAS